MSVRGEGLRAASDEVANAIIGMTVFEAGSYDTADKDGPEINIRVHASEVALSGIRELRGLSESPELIALGLDTGELEPVHMDEIEVVRQEIGAHNLLALRRKLTMAHNLEATTATVVSGEVSDVKGERARAHKQRNLLETISNHWQLVRRPSGIVALEDEAIVSGSGVIGVAPTAAGKSYVMGTLLRRAGIGRKIAPGDDRPLTADIVLPTRQLVRQFAGEEGDDTFRIAFGYDVALSQHHSDRTDSPGHVRLYTREKYRRSVAEGSVLPHDAAAVAWDEAHTMLGPKTLEVALAVKESGVNVAGFTATPGYRLGKDVREHFDHVDAGNLLEFIATEIVQPVELSAYVAPNEKYGAEKMAAQLATVDIREGRGVLVVCGKGGETAQAKMVAKMINDLVGPDSARPVSTYIDGYRDNIQDYEKGDINAMVVSGMLEQGYSSRRGIGSVITVGNITSLLRKTHIAGRVLRHKGGVGYLREIYEPSVLSTPGSAMPATFFEVFGIDEVRQHFRLEPKAIELSDQDEMYQVKPRSEGNQTGAERHSSRTSGGNSEDEGVVYDYDLEKQLLPELPLRKLFLASENMHRSQEPLAGSKELKQLADMYGTLPAFIQKRLAEQGFACQEIWLRSGNAREFERWYGEDAQAYLRDNPPPQLAEETMMNVSQIAQLTGMSVNFIKELVKKESLDAEDRLSALNGIKSGYFTGPDVAIILDAIERIPEALETDVPVEVLAEETEVNFVYNLGKTSKDPICLQYKRRNATFGKQGIVLHISIEDADRAREIWNGDGFMSLMQIANTAGVTLGTVTRNLKNTEKEAIVRRRVDERRQNCLTKEMALAVIERVKPKSIPPHLIPQKALEQMSTMGYTTLHSWLKRQPELSPTTIKTGGKGGDIDCYPWAAVRRLAEDKRLQAHLKMEMLAEEDEQDPIKIAYSTIIQATYIPIEKLANQHIHIDDALTALGCTEPALWAVLEQMDIPQEAFAYDEQGYVSTIKVDALVKIRKRLAGYVREPQSTWTSHVAIIQAAETSGYKAEDAEAILQERLQYLHPSFKGVFRASWGIDVWYEKSVLAFVAQELRNRYPK